MPPFSLFLSLALSFHHRGPVSSLLITLLMYFFFFSCSSFSSSSSSSPLFAIFLSRLIFLPKNNGFQNNTPQKHKRAHAKIRRVPPCAVKACAVRPVFARVVGELRAADPSHVQGLVEQNASSGEQSEAPRPRWKLGQEQNPRKPGQSAHAEATQGVFPRKISVTP